MTSRKIIVAALLVAAPLWGCGGEDKEIASKPLTRNALVSGADKAVDPNDLTALLKNNAVRLEFDFYSRWRDGGRKKTVPCSGVLVGNNHVVTARHCMFDNEDANTGKRADSARAYFKRDGILTDEKRIDVVSKFGEEKFGPYYELEAFDLAVLNLQLDDDLNNYRYAKTASPVARVAPGDPLIHVYWDESAQEIGLVSRCKAKAGVRTSSTDGFPVKKFNFAHTCAEADGMSGSPLFNRDLELVGIHLGVVPNTTTKIAARIGDAWDRAYIDNYKDAFGKLSCSFGADEDCQPIIDEDVDYAGVGLCVNAIRALNIDYSQYADDGEANERYVSQRISFDNYIGYDDSKCEDFGAFFANGETTRCDYPVEVAADADLVADLDTIMESVDECFATANARVPISPPVERIVKNNQICTHEREAVRNSLPPHNQRQCINRETKVQEIGQVIGDTPARLVTIDARRQLYIALGRDGDSETTGYLSFIGIDDRDMRKPKRRNVFDVRAE